MKCKICKIIIMIVFLGIAILELEFFIWEKTEENEIKDMKIDDSRFRAEFYSEEQLEKRNKLAKDNRDILDAVENDVSYYPVAESDVDKSLTTDFVNSWMLERSYGGKRGHEGVDIMASLDKRGVYPIISMTDGVVTNLGWVEKGGYRIGITSDSGIYYYYAHLDSYANVKEGQRIQAGEFLGFMGDSGYGKEGTKGMFAVHLHVGIYVYKNGEEISLNPYYVLCSLENRKLKYVYS